jgi:hypothetical protein
VQPLYTALAFGGCEVWGGISNLIAGLLAAIGGAIFAYVSYFDPNPLNFYGSIIMLLSGLVWTISGILILLRR